MLHPAFRMVLATPRLHNTMPALGRACLTDINNSSDEMPAGDMFLFYGLAWSSATAHFTSKFTLLKETLDLQ